MNLPDNLTYLNEGTARVAYLRDDGKVVKTYSHPIGYKQSEMEKYIWENVPEKFRKHFNPIYEVTEEYQICDYCPSYGEDLHLWDHDINLFTMNTYSSDQKTHGYHIPYIEDSEELVEWLIDHCDLNIGEILSATNFGVSTRNDIVFTDYGMTESTLDLFGECIYDEGLSYVANKSCDNCGEIKKIRMYGADTACVCNHCRNLLTDI